MAVLLNRCRLRGVRRRASLLIRKLAASTRIVIRLLGRHSPAKPIVTFQNIILTTVEAKAKVLHVAGRVYLVDPDRIPNIVYHIGDLCGMEARYNHDCI